MVSLGFLDFETVAKCNPKKAQIRTKAGAGIFMGPYSKGSQHESTGRSEAVIEPGAQPPHFAGREAETHRVPLVGHWEESGFLGQEETTRLRVSVVWLRGCVICEG